LRKKTFDEKETKILSVGQNKICTRVGAHKKKEQRGSKKCAKKKEENYCVLSEGFQLGRKNLVPWNLEKRRL